MGTRTWHQPCISRGFVDYSEQTLHNQTDKHELVYSPDLGQKIGTTKGLTVHFSNNGTVFGSMFLLKSTTSQKF